MPGVRRDDPRRRLVAGRAARGDVACGDEGGGGGGERRCCCDRGGREGCDQAAARCSREEQLGDLDRVQSRALAEVVADDEEGESVRHRRVLPDPADEDVVAACGPAGRRELLQPDPRRRAEQLRRLLRRERLLGLDPHRLGVPHEHGDADAGRADREVGQLEDLLGLLAELLLLLELDAVERPVHPEVVVLGRLRAQALHRLGTRARDRLVGGDAHPDEPSGVVEGLERAGERDRAAIRVRDDPVVLERARRVHLRHDERDPRLEPVGGRLVHRDRAAADGVGDELAARGGADREETEVEVSCGERLGRRLLDRPAGELLPGGAGGREDPDVLVAALA